MRSVQVACPRSAPPPPLTAYFGIFFLQLVVRSGLHTETALHTHSDARLARVGGMFSARVTARRLQHAWPGVHRPR